MDAHARDAIRTTVDIPAPIYRKAEPEALDSRLRSFSTSRHASPKLWADAYLAAFAATAGLKLVTFDRAFRSKAVESLVLA